MPARRTDLAGGAIVVSEAMSSVESVSLGVWFPHGSRHEGRGENGISHFIEHLVFKGTPTRSADAVNREIDLLGGGTNAFTTKETVCLHTRVLAEQLPRALDLFADLARHGLPEGIDEEVERERTVILSEIRGVDDAPEELVGDLIEAALFGEHPLGQPIMGSEEVVSGLDVTALRKRYRSHLADAPVLVAAAGKIDHDELVRFVDASLGSGRGAFRFPSQRRPELTPGTRVLERELEQVQISLAGPGVSARDPRWAAAELLSSVIGDGYSSRLFREVRDRRGLAYSVYSSLSSYSDTGSFGVDLGLAAEHVDEALEVIGRVLADVRAHGVRPEELEAARQQIRCSMLLGRESSGARMSYLAEQILYGQDHLDPARDLAQVMAVTADDVAALAAELLAEPMAIAAVGPVSADRLPPRGFEIRP